jgi:hypothetical protein
MRHCFVQAPEISYLSAKIRQKTGELLPTSQKVRFTLLCLSSYVLHGDEMSSDLNLTAKQPQQVIVNDDQPLVLFEIFEALGKRAFVPFIAIPSVLGLTPLGSSVMFMAIVGIVFVWVGVQLLIGRAFPYLPSRLAYRRLHSRLAHYFTFQLLTSKEWLDEVPHPKMAWLTSSAVAGLAHVALICVGISLPILTYLGQSMFLTCIAALIYCVSILTRDGRYVLAAASVLSIASISPLLQLTS